MLGRGALPQFLWRDVLNVRGDVPRVSERVRDAAHTVAIELILHGSHHLRPGGHRLVEDAVHASEQNAAGKEDWIFYNTSKFSGKKLVVRPSSWFRSIDAGVYSLLVLSGKGTIGGHRVEGGVPGQDELLVTDPIAKAGIDVVNDDPVGELVVISSTAQT